MTKVNESAVRSEEVLNPSMKMLASTGDRGDAMEVPLVCSELEVA